MSECEDLFAIYGAIDRAVHRDPELASQVAPFLPGYSDRGAIGWFDEFEAWTLERVEVSPFPDFELALANLAERPTSGRMAARRIHALAVAARLSPQLLASDANVSIEDALAVEGIAGLHGEDGATTLVSMLTSDEFRSLEQWPQLIETAVDAGFISADLRVQAAAKPCSGTLVKVSTPGDPFPAAQFETTFPTTAVTLQQACRFLEPSNWPDCSPYWCEMDRVATTPTGTHIYHEIFSLDCDHPNRTWTVEAYLEFALIDLGAGAGARVSYALSDQHPNDRILVDEGSLTVQPVGAGVSVHTVKRIKFNHQFSVAALSMIMCALGYGEAAQHLVLDCAVQNAQDPNAGTEFPGTAPPVGEPTGTPSEDAHRVADGDTVDRVMTDAVDKVKQCVDDYASAYTAAYEQMRSGNYKADDVVANMADMWSRYLRDGAVIADLAMRLARAARAGHECLGRPDAGGLTMATGARLVVLDYIDLTEWLVNAWGDRASKIAARLDAGNYTADKAVADASSGAALAMQSLARMVATAFDAAAFMTGEQDQAHIVVSPVFSTADGGGLPDSVRTLRLAGPLVADLGRDALPVSVVSIKPPALRTGETTFRLEADATGHQALGYSGKVEVLDDAGDHVGWVLVWLTA